MLTFDLISVWNARDSTRGETKRPDRHRDVRDDVIRTSRILSVLSRDWTQVITKSFQTCDVTGIDNCDLLGSHFLLW